MISKDDMRQIRWPLAISALLCIAGIVAVVFAEGQLDAARKARELAQQDRTSAQERVTKATDEEREIRQNLVEYDKMVKIGMVGRTNRLNLVERMASIKTERKLFEMRYSIDPQKTVDFPGAAKSPVGGPEFVTNRMQIDMLLLHELDLTTFLRDLQASGSNSSRGEREGQQPGLSDHQGWPRGAGGAAERRAGGVRHAGRAVAVPCRQPRLRAVRGAGMAAGGRGPARCHRPPLGAPTPRPSCHAFGLTMTPCMPTRHPTPAGSSWMS